VIDATVETITNRVSKEERVTLVGFGTFRVIEKRARRGVNPQTREVIQISAKKVTKFKPGKNLREKVIK